MAVLAFQTDPWTLGLPNAAEYGDPAWFRQGPNSDLAGPLAWTNAAERGFDWTDLAFFTKYLHLLTLKELSGEGFVADLRIYGDAASTVAFGGKDFGYLWPWPGASAGPSLTGGTVTGFSGTIQGRAAFSITGLSVPVASLKALASRSDWTLGDTNDLLLAGDDLITGSDRNDALHGGPGGDTIRGAAGGDVLDGQSGNDVLVGGAGDDRLIGGAGRDTAATGALRHQAQIAVIGESIEVRGPEGRDILTGIEIVRFADGTLHWDAAGAAGQVSRLYAASLGRASRHVRLWWLDSGDGSRRDHVERHGGGLRRFTGVPGQPRRAG